MFKRLASFILLATIATFTANGTAYGAIVDFRIGGNLGSVADFDLNNSPPETFSISGIAGLSITFESISSSSAGARINANSDRFGIDSTGTGSGSDDSDEFQASLSEVVSFSFNQAVEITELDFVSFGDAEEFEFAGVTIAGNASNLNGNDVLDLSAATISLNANEVFSMEATSGSIGFQSMTLDVQASAVPESSSLVAIASLGIALTVQRRHSKRKPK